MTVGIILVWWLSVERIAILQLLSGLPLVIILPGYFVQSAFFPRQHDLGTPERVALSLGLSLASIPPLVILLEFLGAPIVFNTIAGAALALLLAVLSISIAQRIRIPAHERFVLLTLPKAQGKPLELENRILLGVLIGALLVTFAAASAIVLTPSPSDEFTEFYLLSTEGIAQDFPRRVQVGESIEVVVGINHRDDTNSRYKVEVAQGGVQLSQRTDITLAPQQEREIVMTFTLEQPSPNLPVDILLFVDEDVQAFRTLRLWFEVI